MSEEKIGKVFSYYSKIGVAAIDLDGELKVGDTIRIKGENTDFKQKVESMQVEHASVETAKAGDSIGMKVKDKVRPHDQVFKITEDEL